MSMNVSEVLDLAADDIERNGWAQGPVGMRADGPHCILGAIGAVMQSRRYHTNIPFQGVVEWTACFDMWDVGRSPAGEAMFEYLDGVGIDGLPNYSAVYRWNDHRSRQQHEVVEALRAAAAVQRAYETEDQPLPIDVAA